MTSLVPEYTRGRGLSFLRKTKIRAKGRVRATLLYIRDEQESGERRERKVHTTTEDGLANCGKTKGF